MKCLLEGSNARIFAKAIQSLAKFGSNLYIEADENGFQLRAVNNNKSAVGTFRFCRNFFETYDSSGGSQSDDNCCRLSMKACLGAFKSMKLVELCKIHIDSERSKFVIQLDCKYETVKHFSISIIDDDNISADVPMDDAPNVIGGSFKLFWEIVSNFHMAEEELTVEAGESTLCIKNYVEGSRVNDNFMRSQLKLSPDEFQEYSISEETAVTFCLREFKAFLLFADAILENVRILFRDPGSPIVFEIKRQGFFEANLIMSTLSPDDITYCENLQPERITESFLQRSTTTAAAQKRKTAKDTSTTSPKRSKKKTAAKEIVLHSTTVSDSLDSNDVPEFRFDLAAQTIEEPRNHASAEMSENFSNMSQTNTDVPAGSEIEEPRNHGSAEMSENFSNIPDLRMSHTNTHAPTRSESEVFVTFVETEEKAMDEEEIPQSPGSKNSEHPRTLRSIFSRCFEATYVPREPSPNSHLFVPESDDET